MVNDCFQIGLTSHRSLLFCPCPHLLQQPRGEAVEACTSAVNTVRMQIPPRSFLIESGLVCQRCEEAEREPFRGENAVVLNRAPPPLKYVQVLSAQAQALDYESKKAYTFKVDATNAHLDPRFQSFGAFKDTATVKINVLDVDEPPVFNKPSYVMDVYEDTPVGTIIGAVTAQDLDAGSSPVRYSIDWKSDLDNYFDIDPVEGTISTNELLDRESIAQHNISIVATKLRVGVKGRKSHVTLLLACICTPLPIDSMEHIEDHGVFCSDLSGRRLTKPQRFARSSEDSAVMQQNQSGSPETE
ncbi:Cadherin-12 Brain cadherin [Takifugu flavidus]|uniref:Cadherin-12 Brain cadherin n=1 Tax=Takifugu flavidus TaxID=433684 RepID=A0A5C6NUK5_9TELE|nr:Cadherin-12 Brain cadherin [Takifugu flavidus]